MRIKVTIGPYQKPSRDTYIMKGGVWGRGSMPLADTANSHAHVLVAFADLVLRNVTPDHCMCGYIGGVAARA